MRGFAGTVQLDSPSAGATASLKARQARRRLGFDYAHGVSSEDQPESGSLRARGEEALGDLAQALVDNPVFSGALARALGAGERAATAQRQAIGALNLAASSDVERLEQRLRSLSARLEAIEDQLDDVTGDVAALRRQGEPGS